MLDHDRGVSRSFAACALLSLLCVDCLADLSALGSAATANDAGAPASDAMHQVDATPDATPNPTDAGSEAADSCVAHQEICNGLDDDCNGTPDNGCPKSLGWSNIARQLPLGDSTGGTDFSDACANDEVLVGLTVFTTDGIRQIHGTCRKFTLKVDVQKNPYDYSFQFGATRDLPSHPPTPGGSMQFLNCSNTQVLVGLKIAQQYFLESTTMTMKLVIPQMWASCAEPRLNTATIPPSVEWHNQVEIGPVAGILVKGGVLDPSATFFEYAATSPSVLVVLHGAAGQWLDRIGVSTSVIQAAVQ